MAANVGGNHLEEVKNYVYVTIPAAFSKSESYLELHIISLDCVHPFTGKLRKI